MSTLVLLTNVFPYSTWEPYLERETDFYGEFDQVHIFSLGLTRQQLSTTRSLSSEHIMVHPVLKGPRWVYVMYAMRMALSRVFLAEISALFRQRRFSARRVVEALVHVSRSRREADIIAESLAVEAPKSSEIVFYAYRYAYQPFVAALLAKDHPGSKIVARAHGLDLYEERHSSDYLPLRKFNLTELDRIYPVSAHGRRYILRGRSAEENRVRVRYLGTEDRGPGPQPPVDRRPLRLLSCSHVVDVKRLDRLVDALALVTHDVRWTHIGSGPLLDRLRERASEVLGGNIEVDLLGSMENDDILEHYSKVPYHLFVNVSESEGVPVSIMEAMSFGVPTLATDVGGTSEVVAHDETGMLIAADATPADIAEGITAFVSCSDDDYARFRVESRRQWSAKFDSEENYKAFARELVELTDT